MADISQIKKQIREMVTQLGKEYGTIFREESVLPNNPTGLKYNGASEEKRICFFICNSKLKSGKVEAGQLDSMLRRCYLLSLSEYENKWIIFTDKEFYDAFMNKYAGYLKGITATYRQSTM